MSDLLLKKPKAIIGLGNPGNQYVYTRHNIGFRIVEALAGLYGASWQEKENFKIAKIIINANPVMLIKPETFMNNSGRVMGYLTKQGIEPEQVLVVHDELEFPLQKITLKIGGSARGHNGLKSIISVIGDNFVRLRFGIGRPERKEDVPDYVLQKFAEPLSTIDNLIQTSAHMIEDLYT
jgi:peptidyl-tRNA hydrolase, PTH1 family